MILKGPWSKSRWSSRRLGKKVPTSCWYHTRKVPCEDCIKWINGAFKLNKKCFYIKRGSDNFHQIVAESVNYSCVWIYLSTSNLEPAIPIYVKVFCSGLSSMYDINKQEYYCIFMSVMIIPLDILMYQGYILFTVLLVAIENFSSFFSIHVALYTTLMALNGLASTQRRHQGISSS